jgi:hypothetical protein
MADILPPIIVLTLQIAAGAMIGASPLVLGAAAAGIVLAAYLVQATKRGRTVAVAVGPGTQAQRVHRTSVQIAPSSVATFEGGPLRASGAANPQGASADLRPVAKPPGVPAVTRVQRLEGSAEPSQPPISDRPDAVGQSEHHSDLDWLWGTILPDPSDRPDRRNDR